MEEDIAQQLRSLKNRIAEFQTLLNSPPRKLSRNSTYFNHQKLLESDSSTINESSSEVEVFQRKPQCPIGQSKAYKSKIIVPDRKEFNYTPISLTKYLSDSSDDEINDLRSRLRTKTFISHIIYDTTSSTDDFSTPSFEQSAESSPSTCDPAPNIQSVEEKVSEHSKASENAEKSEGLSTDSILNFSVPKADSPLSPKSVYQPVYQSTIPDDSDASSVLQQASEHDEITVLNTNTNQLAAADVLEEESESDASDIDEFINKVYKRVSAFKAT